MERLKVRETIQTNGKKLYEQLGKTRKDLQYLAGELMTGNEERVLFNMKSPQLLTMESQDIIDTGFTKNQIIFLESIEDIIRKYDDALIEQYFIKCEFNDECDTCHNDNREQSYMKGTIEEAEYYICRSCALKYIHALDGSKP